MAYALRHAREEEIPAVFDLYAARVRWMDAVGIHQWNETDYLRAYPADYYMDMQRQKLLYVLEGEDGAISGAVVLLRTDERWDGCPQKRAWYVHNLVSAAGASGAGSLILREAERLAKAGGMQAMRLDCADDNARLNGWYEAQGYLPCGACTDGPYHGILREKAL